jgi:multisubunit Na+/H+ antiporter MnhC subunit
MNKRFFIAWAVLFVAWFAGSFVVHGMLLGGDYKALQGQLFRTEADSQQYFPWMILAHVLMSGAFVWIYAKGVESRDWFPQGLRYGVAIALLGIVPTYLIYFAVQPTPQALVIKQIVFDGALMLVLGVIVAFIYRDAGRPAV